jgi:V8-like Glu-specific endopeptidase
MIGFFECLNPGRLRHTTTPGRPPLRHARPVLERMEGRQLLSLTPVSDYAKYPYTAIVELTATFPDHQTYVGTGVLIDAFHVLTAGHVLYSYRDGGFASAIIATPELSGNYQPYGTASTTYMRTFTTFTSYNRTHPGLTAPGDMDIGLLTLNRSIGNYTGWMSFGYDNNNADFNPGTVYNTAGYPSAGGYDGRHMQFSAGPIAGLSSDGSALQYYQSAVTAYGGQSGSPVWRYTPSTNSSVVYAVHVGGSGAANSLNFATRITQSIFNSLQSWRNADAVPRTSVLVSSREQAASPAHPFGVAEPSSTPVISTVLTRAGTTTPQAQVALAAPVEWPLVAAPIEALAAKPAVRRHLDLFDTILERLLTEDRFITAV